MIEKKKEEIISVSVRNYFFLLCFFFIFIFILIFYFSLLFFIRVNIEPSNRNDKSKTIDVKTNVIAILG